MAFLLLKQYTHYKKPVRPKDESVPQRKQDEFKCN